jgi:DNA topoisomerase-3
VIAEKPSVARSIADVLGAKRREPGLCRGNGYVVTWAIGHLVGLAEPGEMDPGWKPWRYERLPMLPRDWGLRVLAQTKDHFAIVEALLNSSEIERVVCATDAGREGELIFRYILRKAGCRKPVQRLWISSLTPDAIQAGFKGLRPSEDFDNLAAAAEARSRADWLVGMNFTRAYTLRHGPELLSVGRVQTPTLAMIVEREKAIRDFVPVEYCEVEATFGLDRDAYSAVWFDPAKSRSEGEDVGQRLPADGVLAETIRSRCDGKPARVVDSTGTDKSFPPPLLYDLTELQRHANRLYGMTAQATLTAAQALYEQHKLLSYPRTDSRHLSASVAASIGPVVVGIAPPYGEAVAPGTGTTPLSRRFVDDSKVTDHHAIIPTGAPREGRGLGRDEERLYDLVCRRLLMAWHADHKTRVTKVVTRVPAEAAPGSPADLFRSTGTVVTQAGWKVLDIEPRKSKKKGAVEDPERRLPEGLAAGQVRPVTAIEVQHKQTSPPRRFTDATLLTAMESAGRALDSRELEEAMRERGLGTPATRAAILETLLTRSYIERQGKSLHATEKGIALIDVVHESVKSPQLTGEWELALKKLERGQGSLPELMAGIERFVIEVIGDLRGAEGPGPVPLSSGGGERSRVPAAHHVLKEIRNGDPLSPVGSLPWREGELPVHCHGGEGKTGGVTVASPGDGGLVPLAPRNGERAGERGSAALERGSVATEHRPRPAGELTAILSERFGHRAFRANQEEVCKAVTAGDDALLVMPTGSGKSLCYQLPGIARGGTTLVISPLIALMEDQTAKLREKGFRAEQIHSGRTREQSRAVCRAYLDGALDFLTIAPERLSVAGFPEMLARRRPALVAVDEAHCISHWGHDFRPDYRLLGGRLPLLRPSPVLAVTATATVRVQDDILTQLGIGKARRFIRGFRRENLAIEAVERPRGERVDLALATLGPAERRPALVYVPSRKMAEEVAEALVAARFRAAPYHAGLDAQTRSRTQEAFQRGELEVVVATIAFGMGIDKADIRTVIHLGLPGTVEGYYQEIGRAGRDGLPARALLCYSWADRKMHESFLERDYAETSILEALLEKVPEHGIERSALLSTCGLDMEIAEPALGKLWIHGGVTVDSSDVVRRGKKGWQPRYEAIRAYRRAQLDEVLQFAQSGDCRMVRLVRHFGETRDEELCGSCDACLPHGCVGRRFREASKAQLSLAKRILEELERKDGLSTGTLMRNLFPSGGIERRDFERTLDALARAGALSLREDEFEKEGKTIRFRRADLASNARGALRGHLLLFDDEVPSRAGSPSAKRRKRKSAEAKKQDSALSPPSDPGLERRLREWRQKVAKARGVPAFVVLTDKVLQAIACLKPASLSALLEIKGAGPKLAEKHGAEIFQLVRSV